APHAGVEDADRVTRRHALPWAGVMDERTGCDKRSDPGWPPRRASDPIPDNAPERVPPLAAARREADDRDTARHLGGDALEGGACRAAGELVELGRDHGGRQRHGGDEGEDLLLLRLETAPHVDDQHDAALRGRAEEAGLGDPHARNAQPAARFCSPGVSPRARFTARIWVT